MVVKSTYILFIYQIQKTFQADLTLARKVFLLNTHSIMTLVIEQYLFELVQPVYSCVYDRQKIMAIVAVMVLSPPLLLQMRL